MEMPRMFGKSAPENGKNWYSRLKLVLGMPAIWYLNLMRIGLQTLEYVSKIINGQQNCSQYKCTCFTV